MINKDKLCDELTDLFMGYQHTLENPMPSPEDCPQSILLKYRTDTMFHAKVERLVCGVMGVVVKHDKKVSPGLIWKDPNIYHDVSPDDVIIYKPKCAVNFEFTVGRAEDIKWDRVDMYINLGDL